MKFNFDMKNSSTPYLIAMVSLTLAFAVFGVIDRVALADTDNDTLKTDISAETTTYVETTSATVTTKAETTVTTSVTTTEETTTEATTTTAAMVYPKGSKELGTYSSNFTSLTLDQLSSLNTEGIVIVGDSIASGFKVYKRLPERQVMATGSLGARNIHDFKVTLNGAEYSVTDSVKILQPEYICMSMGMNDLNIGTMEDYINNYTANINELHAVSPNSKFIIMAITPIAAGISHSTNQKIDTYNEALYNMVNERNDIPIYYVNAAQTLKNQWNSLGTTYSGGDGIHLTPVSYDAMLTYLLGALSEIDDSYTNEVSAVTTAPPKWTAPATTATSAPKWTAPAVTTVPNGN